MVAVLKLILIKKILAMVIEDRLWIFLICGIDHNKIATRTHERKILGVHNILIEYIVNHN